MKQRASIKTALAVLCAAAIIVPAAAVGTAYTTGAPAAVAFAEENEKSTVYPSLFIHDLSDKLSGNVITDYDVDGENLAFAVGTVLYSMYIDTDGEKKCRKYENDSSITALAYYEGKLFFKTAGDVYVYNHPNKVSYEGDGPSFGSSQFPIAIDGAYYAYDEHEKELFYFDGGITSLGKGFTDVKHYEDDNIIFALNDNKLYKIEGSSCEEVSLAYTDFTDADNIYTADVGKKLKNSSYEVAIANIKPDSYVTKIKDDEIGETFNQEIKGNSTKKSDGIPCVVLCTSGNATLFVTNEGMFITATENLNGDEYTSPTDRRVGKSFYTVEDTGVYSRPYVCEATRIATLKSGSEHIVTVTECFYLDYINTEFVRVSYEDEEGETISGFVAANFLTEYSFAAEENEAEELPYEDYSQKTNVVAVVLIIIIVALIIIAVLYFAALLAKNKSKEKHRNKKKKKKKPEYDEDDEDDEDEDDEDEDE